MFWRAKTGEKYFFIDFEYLEAGFDFEKDRDDDSFRYNMGNYFKTEKECDEYIQIIRLLLSQRCDKKKLFKKMVEIAIK